MKQFVVNADIDTADLKGFDLVEKMRKTVMDNLPQDLQIAMAMGCQIETFMVGTHTMQIKTKYPISILRDKKGKVYDIIEDRGGKYFKRGGGWGIPVIS